MIIECPECKHVFEAGKKKNFALNLIQIAWVIEVIVYHVFAYLLIILQWNSAFDMLVTITPQIVILISGQGAIAGGGPLISQALKKKEE